MSGYVTVGQSAALAATMLVVGVVLGGAGIYSWFARRGGPWQDGYQYGYDDGVWRERRDREREALRRIVRVEGHAPAARRRRRDSTEGGGLWLS